MKIKINMSKQFDRLGRKYRKEFEGKSWVEIITALNQLEGQ